jgi:hypothetical protein
MVFAVAGLMIAMFVVLAAPAMPNDNDRNNHHKNDNYRNNHHNRFDFDDDDDFDFDFDDDLDQDADSGDVDQSFVVTNTGDNSNQCANVQGVANTGNAQDQIGVSQFGDGFGDFDRGHHDRFFSRDFDFDGFNDDFEIEDSGASVVVSPTNTTTCDQQVNQAAAAYGGGGPYYYYW